MPHSQTMLARLDTASSKVHRIDIPQTKVGDTTFLWAPLASANNHYFHNILTNRYPTGRSQRRPYLAAFLSANCQPHRTTFSTSSERWRSRRAWTSRRMASTRSVLATTITCGSR